MRLSADIARQDAVAATWRVERRWVMNFAAAVGDDSACYFGADNMPPVVHPLYHAQIEWRLRKLLTMQADIPAQLRSRAIHTSQYLQVERLLRVGETVTSRAEIIGAEPARSGTRLITRFDTADHSGARISLAIAGTVYQQVTLTGRPVIPPTTLPRADRTLAQPAARARKHILRLPLGAAHVYGECARIWNPIHSDPATARSAGLPGTIMHGSGLLAMAVGDVIRREGKGSPSAVRLVTGRFRAPVMLPQEPVLHVSAAPRQAGQRIIIFSLVREDGIVAMEGSCALA